ncbi:MAG: acyltransferase, partial [Lachnospiraceae bacterium]|nr:acyltransferase [Lachnospiraceae bacterium]
AEQSRAEQSRAEQSRAEQLSICRYDGLDILKSICAFLIVCIHCPFPGETGQYIVALARIAVPIFFMITGFFYDGTVRRNSVGKQIKKVTVLLIEANLLFFIWKLLLAMHSGVSFIGFLQDTITIKSILKFILLNESLFNSHLWYLGAILYVLIIYAVVDGLYVRKLLYIVTPVLLVGDLILGKYSLVLLGREFPYIIVRNFLFVGIPYFTIGCLLKQHEDWIKEHGKTGILIGLAILFTATTILERYILVSIDMNPTRDHYISSTLLAVTMFVIAVKGIGLYGRKGRTTGVLSTIGRKYSTWVYIIHPIFNNSPGCNYEQVRNLWCLSVYSTDSGLPCYVCVCGVCI